MGWGGWPWPTTEKEDSHETPVPILRGGGRRAAVEVPDLVLPPARPAHRETHHRAYEDDQAPGRGAAPQATLRGATGRRVRRAGGRDRDRRCTPRRPGSALRDRRSRFAAD